MRNGNTVCISNHQGDLLIIVPGFIAQDAVCLNENYKNGIFQMAQMGAVITNVETILFDLLKKAGTPQFKKLSKLIR